MKIMKAVAFDKLSANTKLRFGNVKALRERGWLLQPKLDGCYMAVFVKDGCVTKITSRTGEIVRSMDHVADEVSMAARRMRNLGEFVMIGEAWNKWNSFPEISGRFRQHSNAFLLHFYGHDLVPTVGGTIADSLLSYETRYSILAQMIDEAAFCYMVDYDMVDYDDPELAAMDLVQQGGHDGAILRDRHAGYTLGPVKNAEIVKVKPNITLDLKVVAVNEGIGAKTGRTVWTLDVVYNDVITSVGSGVGHMYDNDWLGGIAEIECLGVTASGKLREPRFKGMRFDKDRAD